MSSLQKLLDAQASSSTDGDAGETPTTTSTTTTPGKYRPRFKVNKSASPGSTMPADAETPPARYRRQRFNSTGEPPRPKRTGEGVGRCPGVHGDVDTTEQAPDLPSGPLVDEDGAPSELFFDFFKEKSDVFQKLLVGKELLAKDEHVWKLRDLPRTKLINQFYNCMEEVDEACDGYFVKKGKQEGSHTFLDIGCAPGGMSRLLLKNGWDKGAGMTLLIKGKGKEGHEMDEGFLEDIRPEGKHGKDFTLYYQDCTVNPSDIAFTKDIKIVDADTPKEAPREKFDFVIAGARTSRTGDQNEDGRIQSKILLASQYLAALKNLKRGGDLLLVLNVTPHYTYVNPICLLRTMFKKIVAVKPESCFKYRSSYYLVAFDFDPDAGMVGGKTVYQRIEATLEKLRAGENVLCPVMDVPHDELFLAHGNAIKQLLEPLWSLQTSVIHDLLNRHPSKGGSSWGPAKRYEGGAASSKRDSFWGSSGKTSWGNSRSSATEGGARNAKPVWGTPKRHQDSPNPPPSSGRSDRDAPWSAPKRSSPSTSAPEPHTSGSSSAAPWSRSTSGTEKSAAPWGASSRATPMQSKPVATPEPAIPPPAKLSVGGLAQGAAWGDRVEDSVDTLPPPPASGPPKKSPWSAPIAKSAEAAPAIAEAPKKNPWGATPNPTAAVSKPAEQPKTTAPTPAAPSQPPKKPGNAWGVTQPVKPVSIRVDEADAATKPAKKAPGAGPWGAPIRVDKSKTAAQGAWGTPK